MDMDEVQRIVDRLWKLMKERKYPSSVMQTVIGAIDLATNPMKTAEEIEPLIIAAKTPKEAVKAVQRFFVG